MKPHFVLTPFYLDQPLAGLDGLAGSGWEINAPPLPAGGVSLRLSHLYRPLVSSVGAAVSRGHRPVSVAGDCLTSLAVLAGLQRAGRQPSLIWLDAHGDFNTWETTPSGFLGGMPWP